MAQIQPTGIFTSTTLPDVDPRSHVIGLVGIHDHEDTASPANDGWLLSDFYLFYHLFNGLCKSHAWFTCLDPQYLVDKYDEYAHGNPYHERRIVLDRDQVKHRDLNSIIIADEAQLLTAFLAHLRTECQRADAAQEPVLLLVFGHGDGTTRGIEIGRLSDGTTPLLSMTMMKTFLQDLPSLKLSALLTSCFSGGWTTYLNMTIMTAAGEEKLSESWPQSYSLGRATGSIFASAIVERLCANDPQANADDVTYRQFTDDVRAKLLLLDKYDDTHEIQFSSQDDDWEMEYHRRTGIPRATFQERLARLRTIASTNRDEHPHGDRTSEEQLRAWGQLPTTDTILQPRNSLTGSLRGRFGGPQTSVENLMRKRAAGYLASHPGRDSMSGNHRVHGLARRCLNHQCTWEELDQLAACLDYREKAMTVARSLLPVMGVAPFVPDWQWDYHEWMLDPMIRQRLIQSESACRRILDAQLIPRPNVGEGHFMMKPVYYLCAALYHYNLNNDEINHRINQACHCTSSSVRLI